MFTRLVVSIASGGLGVIRLRGLVRDQVKEETLINVASDSADDLNAALMSWLDSRPRVPGFLRLLPTKVTVVLDDDIVRYVQVPWIDGLEGDEVEALVEARFEEGFGDMSDWHIRDAAGHYGVGRVAMAAPKTLLKNLMNGLRKRHCYVHVVTGHYLVAWNRWHREILRHHDSGPVMFAVHQTDSATLGVIDSGWHDWVSLRHIRVAGDLRNLAPLMRREALLLGLDDTVKFWLHGLQAPQPVAEKFNCLPAPANRPWPLIMANNAMPD